MKIVAKVFGIIAVSTLGFVLFVATAFASPSLSDADITFSIKGYFNQYIVDTSYTSGQYITSDGTSGSDSSVNLRLSDFVPVYAGGTFFSYNVSNSNLFPLIYVCFYDSNYSVVSGGFDGNYLQPSLPGNYITFISVPSNAAFVRYTILGSYSGSGATNRYKAVAAPQSGVNANNYQYLWSEISDVTMDSDGVITLPYQVYTYTYVMLDFRFFNSTFQFSSLAFNCYTTYTGGYFDGERLLTYGSGGISVDSYFIDDYGNMTVDGSIGYSETDNPYRCYAQIPYDRFSGFRIYISLLPGQVSTSLKIKVYDFELDGVGTLVHLQMNNAINDLENIGDQLEVPSPDPSAIYANINTITLQMQDANFGYLDWFGPANGILMTMMVTVFTFAALGYILYGKR